MTSNEYNAAYLEAIEMLRGRGKIVEDPYTMPDGIRLVLVDGVPWMDELVLDEAWGKEAADYIRQSFSN